MEAHNIRIEIDRPGRGEVAVEMSSCPIKGNDNICRIELIQCKYGLTEATIPEPNCPFWQDNTVTIRFKAIPRFKEEQCQKN